MHFHLNVVECRNAVEKKCHVKFQRGKAQSEIGDSKLLIVFKLGKKYTSAGAITANRGIVMSLSKTDEVVSDESTMKKRISLAVYVGQSMVLVVAIAIIGIIVLPLLQLKKAKRPTLNMQSYAVSQKDCSISPFSADEGSSSDFSLKIEELKLAGLSQYSQAACIKGNTVEGTREALKKQLSSVPVEVRDEIGSFAVEEGMTTTNSRHTMHAANGVLHSSFAWWSTEHTSNALVTSPYSTCVMVSGVEMEAGDEIKARETSKRILDDIVGWEPCHCGLIWCEKCPVYDTEEIYTTETTKHQFTLREQQDLHNWLVQQAVKPALSLVGTGGKAKTLQEEEPEA